MTFSAMLRGPECGQQVAFGKGMVWRVVQLSEDGQRAVLLADTPAGVRPYHDRYEETDWEHCTLRQWLNGEYYGETFSPAEKPRILETPHSNPSNEKRNTPGGCDTVDRLWLLSPQELRTLLPRKEDRAKGVLWRLRAPGSFRCDSVFVANDGFINLYGYDVDHPECVFPALTVSLAPQ